MAPRESTGTAAGTDEPTFHFGPEAMLVIGEDGTVVRANRRARLLHGGGASELVGEAVEALLGPSRGDDATDPTTWLHSVRDHGGAARPVSLTGRRTDGSTFPAEVTASAVPTSSALVVAVRDVSVRARNLTRTAAMLDFAPDAIVVVDTQGCVTFANRQVAAVFGWQPHELVGESVDVLVPESYQEGHGALREGFFATPRLREMGAGKHLLGRHRDGTEFPVEISLSPLPGEPREVMAAIRDVTDRREAERRARAMLEFAPDATVIVDREGRIVHANRQVAALFGHDVDDLVGRGVEDLLPQRHRWSHVAHRDSFFSAPRVREMGAGHQLHALRADGTEFAVEISLSPLPGRDPEVMATIRDVSERRAASEALAAALQREREAARALRDATRVKDEFLDIAAHELRTPLASISGFAAALIDDWDAHDEAWKRGLVERVLRNARSMNELTERLLDASRLQAGRVKVEPVPTDLTALLEDLVSGLGVLEGREVQLEVSVDGPVTTDPRAVSHIVSNLLTNAAKYSSPPSPIELVARRDAGGVEIVVTDHGVGIPADDLPHLFEHFYRGSNQSHGRGSGVGLSVAQQYAELLGGTILAESVRGAGSTFTAWVPDAPSPGQEDA